MFIVNVKMILNVVPCFALPLRSPIFAIRGAPSPLLAHIVAGHKAFHPPASKLAVGSGFCP